MSIFIEIIGWLSSLLIVAAYAANLRGMIQSDSKLYIWANLLGGLGFIVNTFVHKAYPSMAVNIVWVLIAIWSILGKKK
jgi:lysylphosphatidylglycerol synthetase-like protein (DUF2156 family)